ncbi:hypothetical protein ABZ890_43145 [Streptomyces sp. NPDC046984]|uniref:hypothetical protein n=1 Tax=Streptomyces sp. NPDC046984 TaxID=3155138 RepID=UPI0033D928E9
MAEKLFSFNTQPHVAKLGDSAELHFIPEVFGDQFLDGYKKIQDAREKISGQTDLTALSSEELRSLYAAMRTFLAGLMTPESAAKFLRFEVIKGGKTVADFRSRDEANAHAAGLAGARVEDKSMRLPDRVLTEYHVAFVPAGGAVTLDGQVGRAFVECGGVCEASPDVYGRNGQPPSWATLGCATYCLAISSDVANPPSPEVLITVNVSGRGY